jgi:hypothetical protein
MTDPEGIYNWRRLDDRITTSGQPTEPQLADIQALGVRHVINLALHTHERALADETASVNRLGMTYTHIPVDFQNPTDQDFEKFCAVMEQLKHESGARPLHRELPGLGVFLPVSAGCARVGRREGALADGCDLEAGGCVGEVYSALTLPQGPDATAEMVRSFLEHPLPPGMHHE